MASIDKGFWRYGFFQIPAIILGLCLLVAAIVSNLAIPCTLFWRLLVWALVAISLAWALVLPLDRLLKFQTQLPMNLRGRIALGNALFWTALILSLMVSRLPPIWSLCSVNLPNNDNSELVSLDWARWRANVWDEMFYDVPQPSSIPIGTEAEFSFTVTRDKAVNNIKVQSNELTYQDFVNERILALNGSEVLTFIPSTQRTEVDYESSVVVCNDDSDGCGSRADPIDYQDVEDYEK